MNTQISGTTMGTMCYKGGTAERVHARPSLTTTAEVAATMATRKAIRDPQSIKTLDRRRKRAFSGVYFLQGSNSLNIKIGFSTNVAKRALSLATASSEELRFVGAIKGSKDDERALHERFAPHRVRGEWFEACDELVAFIQEQTNALPERGWIFKV